jgi:hypothetical protein
VVVADVEADVEGEREGGSLDVEERNVMSRTAIGRADVVLVVADPGMKGIHSSARVVGDLLGLGVPGYRVIPVLNRAPRSRRLRAELVAAFAALACPDPASLAHASHVMTGGSVVASEQGSTPSPIFVPERRVEECLRDGVRLPSQMTIPVTGAVRAVLDRHGARRPAFAGPEMVTPGSVGHWGSDDTGTGTDAEEALG